MSEPNRIAGREAADWFMIIHDTEDPPPEVLQQWLAWLDASEENQRAFERTARIWHAALPQLAAVDAEGRADDDYEGSQSIAEWCAEKKQRLDQPAAAPSAPPRRPRFLGWIGAAAAVLAGMLITPVALRETRSGLQSSPISHGEVTTRTGEHRELTLSDGSHVTVGARTRLSAALDDRARTIHLDSGEAFFSVARDARRAFTVLTRNGSITAIGTAFNVRASGDRVIVGVTEGVVRISQQGARLELARGEQLTLGALREHVADVSPTIQKIDPREPARWRAGWLVYRHEPLREVVADLARYTDLEIDVLDSVAEFPFSGAVHRERIPEWLNGLPEIIPVVVETHGERLTIRPRPP